MKNQRQNMDKLRTSTILMWIGYPILISAFFVSPEATTPVAATGAFIAAAAALCNFIGD